MTGFLKLSPCGYAVDFLRSCYRTKARIFNDSPEEVVIQWYRPNPPVRVLPTRTIFGSLNWSDKKTDHGGLGEIGGRPRTWSNGDDFWDLTPVFVCPDILAMQGGVPFASPDVVPGCCTNVRGVLPLGLRLEGFVVPRPGCTNAFCCRVGGTFYNDDCTYTPGERYVTICPPDGEHYERVETHAWGGCGSVTSVTARVIFSDGSFEDHPELRFERDELIAFETFNPGACGDLGGSLPLGFRLDCTVSGPPELLGELPLGFRLDCTVSGPPELLGELPLGFRLTSSSSFTPTPTDVFTDCCGPLVGVSAALKATLNVPGCPCLAGAVINVDYQATGPDAGKWTGTGDPCGGGTTAIGFKLWCSSGAFPQWHCQPTGCIATIFDPFPNPMSTCSPFKQIFDSFSVPSGCCPGGGGALLMSVTFETR